MNEIETKRKELEEAISGIILSNGGFTMQNLIAEELNGFNLGVSMARKEILEKINKMFDEIEFNYNGQEHSSMPLHLSDIKDYREEIKKSLEVKE